MITWPCIYDEEAKGGMFLTVTEIDVDGIYHVRPYRQGDGFHGAAPHDYESGAEGEFIVQGDFTQ